MKLQGKKIIYLVDEGFEDLEFWVPLMRLREEGAEVTVASAKIQTYRGKHCLQATPDVKTDDLRADDFDGIVVPGGWAPDKMRRYSSVLKLVRDTYDQGKIVGAICHAGSVLISAGVVQGHKATGSTGIKDDLINAGAEWVNAPAFRDGNLVWGRVVEDIPDFCRELIAALS
ncbi:MAG TPA: type 1 glutamine amidotransferase domain-containing protein [Anaerolineales bacterium]|nr:type 1 glutamine amidotransferase domain-containing protein [Anaerolineales bacterium]